jgi:hypothetical protein
MMGSAVRQKKKQEQNFYNRNAAVNKKIKKLNSVHFYCYIVGSATSFPLSVA